MKKIKIGLLGCGTVGQSVYKLLKLNRNKYLAILDGVELEIVKILVNDLEKDRDSIPGELLTTNPHDIIANKEIDIVIEVIGGTSIAEEYITEAIRNGKHIITANKDLMATRGQEILELGNEYFKEVKYEASVAGAIPIISTIKDNLQSNQITKVMGIINGTTNFILTKMFAERRSLEDVLQEAKDLGYAEADPTSDIEGLDAARKIAILASIAFSRRVKLENVYVEGITKISVDDVNYARQFKSTIKLLGIAILKDDAIEVRVHPTLLPLSHPLAKVDDVYNAVYLEGNAFGDLTLIGKGAGGLPTASAVVSDLLSIVKNMNKDILKVQNCSCYLDLLIKKIEDTISHYYFRMVVVDKTRVLSKIADAFASNNVSIDSVIQRKLPDGKAELVILTDRVLNKNMQSAREQIENLDVVIEIKSVLRSEKEY
ncbi:MAG: homoserine dehydrogenase [Fusobacteria bacterium]|nr:MAG: homoserine dehydrogenase [Fusobacteriota bacterium]KAF0229870.1 MAG: homoserine [Fusobacteriota bacterium]